MQNEIEASTLELVTEWEGSVKLNIGWQKYTIKKNTGKSKD